MIGRLAARLRAGPHHESGQAAVEFVLMVPVFVLLVLLVVGLGRVASARGEVHGAARDAARAASIQRQPGPAAAAARKAAARDLSGRGVTCTNRTVDVNTADFRPGGHVAVTVACTVNLSETTMVGLPGQTTLTARSASPVEQYKGGM